jgi:hypothetical protein
MGNGRMNNGGPRGLGDARPILTNTDLREMSARRSAEDLQQSMVEQQMTMQRESFELEVRRLACEFTIRAIGGEAAVIGVFPDAAAFVEQAAVVRDFLLGQNVAMVSHVVVDAAEWADRVEELRGDA